MYQAAPFIAGYHYRVSNRVWILNYFHPPPTIFGSNPHNFRLGKSLRRKFLTWVIVNQKPQVRDIKCQGHNNGKCGKFFFQKLNYNINQYQKSAWIFQNNSMGISSYENDISLIISYPPLPSFQIPQALDSPHLALLGKVLLPITRKLERGR